MKYFKNRNILIGNCNASIRATTSPAWDVQRSIVQKKTQCARVSKQSGKRATPIFRRCLRLHNNPHSETSRTYKAVKLICVDWLVFRMFPVCFETPSDTYRRAHIGYYYYPGRAIISSACEIFKRVAGITLAFLISNQPYLREFFTRVSVLRTIVYPECHHGTVGCRIQSQDRGSRIPGHEQRCVIHSQVREIIYYASF